MIYNHYIFYLLWCTAVWEDRSTFLFLIMENKLESIRDAQWNAWWSAYQASKAREEANKYLRAMGKAI